MDVVMWYDNVDPSDELKIDKWKPMRVIHKMTPSIQSEKR